MLSSQPILYCPLLLSPSIFPNISVFSNEMLILQQSRNIALSIKIQAAQSHIKPIDIPKLTTGHFIALQTEKKKLYPPEHQHMLP